MSGKVKANESEPQSLAFSVQAEIQFEDLHHRAVTKNSAFL